MQRALTLSCGLFLVLLAEGVAAEPPERADRDDLSRAFAEHRRAQITSVDYDLEFKLKKAAEIFDGMAEIRVELAHTNAPLSVDLSATRILAVRANGETVDDIVERTGSFDIPPRHLKTGANTVTITYVGAYSGNGMGLTQMTDPVDGREYLHSNLEPYGAHHMFPCFDQPDIKGTYRVTVTAPKDWVVIGNEPIASEEPRGDRIRWRFETTPPLSTYLVFLGGGEYRAWRSIYRGMPLTIYARESLADYVDTDRLFSETKAGLDYFTQYFKTPYPFSKYDHIFAPELRPGAMENPGAVTMNESMIYRGPVTTDRYRRRNNTILHEMAHMWFGDLVTMVWWNDLWLNESFATFSAYQAQAALDDPEKVWRNFYEMKGWAYYQDQLSTTHPIETEVPWATLATANFDGITYGKGAAVLKQLAFYVGDDAYQRGVADYFKRHAWKNATREQFIAAIAEAAGVDLDTWSARWIQQEGLSKMALSFDCEDNRIGNPVMRQDSLNAPLPAPHKTRLGIFRTNAAGVLALERQIPLAFAGEQEPVPDLAGQPCPEFIFPNYGDMDYGLYFLDARSYETAVARLDRLEDPLTRQMVWGTLFSMVRHQRLAASELFRVLLDQIPAEGDSHLLDYLVSGGGMRQLYFQFLTEEKRARHTERLEHMLWDRLQAADRHTDARLIWLDAYIHYATSPEARDRLESLLQESGLDQQRRWRILRRLVLLETPGMESRIAAELERDSTSSGERQALSCRVAAPDAENKRTYWNLLSEGELPPPSVQAAAGAFHSALHPELTRTFYNEWLRHVRATDWEKESHLIRSWFQRLFPITYDRDVLRTYRNDFEASELPPRARRAWQERLEWAERIAAIRNYDARAESNLENGVPHD